jgi:Concanavalin A-like lectin/glucanases superfamily
METRKNHPRSGRVPFVLVITFVALSVAVSLPAVAKDLALRFPFDVDADDESGNGNDGTSYYTSTGSAIVGDGFDFNGSSSYVSFPDIGIFDGIHSWGIIFWFKADDVETLASLVDLHGEAKIVVRVDDDELVAMSKIAGTWRILSTSVQAGEWYHVSYSYDTIDGTALYLDGRQVGTNSSVGSIPAEEDPGVNRVGAYFRDTEFFDGVIDDVQIYQWD